MKRSTPIVLAALLGTAAALSAFAQNANQPQTAKQAPAFVRPGESVLRTADRTDGRPGVEFRQCRVSTFNSPSLATMSSAEVAGLTSLSIEVMRPSLSM